MDALSGLTAFKVKDFESKEMAACCSALAS